MKRRTNLIRPLFYGWVVVRELCKIKMHDGKLHLRFTVSKWRKLYGLSRQSARTMHRRAAFFTIQRLGQRTLDPTGVTGNHKGLGILRRLR
jgi:hypothetical protein